MNWKDKYNRHNSVAKVRDIDFTLTFEEWMYIWIASGQWMNRGNRKGQYVMSRVGDQGGYTIGNVFIQQHGQNLSDAHKGKSSAMKGKSHSKETKVKMSEAKKGNTYAKGTIQTDEHKSKISQALKGKNKPIRSEEHRLKLSIASKGKIRGSYKKKEIVSG